MRFFDRFLVTRSTRARGRMAYRLLRSIVVLERVEPAPVRARSSARATRPRG